MKSRLLYPCHFFSFRPLKEGLDAVPDRSRLFKKYNKSLRGAISVSACTVTQGLPFTAVLLCDGQHA